MSRLRARCPDCRTLTAVAVGPEYQCHSCGREFLAGLVRVPRAWGDGGETMADAAHLELPYPEASVIEADSLAEQNLLLACELPDRPIVLGGCCCSHVGAIEALSAIDAGGALADRIAALRDIAARIGGAARITLDPSERHGFEYQSWFGFTLYADGVRGALGRGGTYRIRREDGAGEVATGFSLYPDALVGQGTGEASRDTLFLPLGHDREIAARLRAIGWRTVAGLSEADDAAALGCSHRLDGIDPVKL